MYVYVSSKGDEEAYFTIEGGWSPLGFMDSVEILFYKKIKGKISEIFLGSLNFPQEGKAPN